jgi:hypothetical protein
MKISGHIVTWDDFKDIGSRSLPNAGGSSDNPKPSGAGEDSAPGPSRPKKPEIVTPLRHIEFGD